MILNNTFRIIVLAALCLGTSVGASAADGSYKKYLPQIHGNIRAKYEYSTTDDQSRFAVRNARVKIDGYALPMVDYLVQVDFSNYGKISLMDAYVRVAPVQNLKIFLGQARVPFSVDASRDLHQYFFSDLSCGAKYLGNLRSVGLKAGYTLPGTNLYFEGGVFNASNMADHQKWNKSMTYGIKANYALPFGLTPQVCFMSRKPDNGVRYNQADVSVSWGNKHWFFEGEYLYCHYTRSSFADAHTYNFIADYGFDVRGKLISRLSFRGRFDGMTAISNGVLNDEGRLTATYPERKRITAGVRTSYVRGGASLDFLVNFEQYFYPDKIEKVAPADNNRLVAMVIVHF